MDAAMQQLREFEEASRGVSVCFSLFDLDAFAVVLLCSFNRPILPQIELILRNT